jgi:hypothetical protein
LLQGGVSTRIHLAVDDRRRPLSVLLTAGQPGDEPQLFTVLDAPSECTTVAPVGLARGRPC